MNLIVEVSPEGEVLVYAEDGVPGEACSLAVQQLAQKLGIVTEEEHLPDYYAAESETNRPPVRQAQQGSCQ